MDRLKSCLDSKNEMKYFVSILMPTNFLQRIFNEEVDGEEDEECIRKYDYTERYHQVIRLGESGNNRSSAFAQFRNPRMRICLHCWSIWKWKIDSDEYYRDARYSNFWRIYVFGGTYRQNA